MRPTRRVPALVLLLVVASALAVPPHVHVPWLLIGIVLLVYYAASGRDRWLKTAGAALGESEDDVAMAKVAPVSPKV